MARLPAAERLRWKLERKLLDYRGVPPFEVRLGAFGLGRAAPQIRRLLVSVELGVKLGAKIRE